MAEPNLGELRWHDDRGIVSVKTGNQLFQVIAGYASKKDRRAFGKWIVDQWNRSIESGEGK